MSETLKYFLNMKRFPLVILLIVAASFLAFKTMGNGNRNQKNPPSKYEKILKLVGDMLSQAPYSPQNINDVFSILEIYISNAQFY